MDTRKPKKYYFAYGSNMARRQMKSDGTPLDGDGASLDRCPDSLPVAPFELHGYSLAFVGERTKRWGRGGVATIVPCEHGTVHGAIYRLSEEDKRYLDSYEGVSEGHYYKDLSVVSFEGEPVLVYIAAEGKGENKPNHRYLERIKEGYRDWGLPLDALDRIDTYPTEG